MYTRVHLEKIFKNEVFFPFEQSTKNIIIIISWLLLYETKDDVR